MLKPENWQMEYAPEPKIAAEIQRQIQEAIAKKKSADIGMCTNEKSDQSFTILLSLYDGKTKIFV